MKELGLDGGRYINSEHYFTQNLAGESVRRVIVDTGEDRLRSKQLSVLTDTDVSMWPRLICFPTSLAVGINALSGQRLFEYSRFDGLDIGSIFAAGIESHINDEVGPGGETIRMGYPSFDRLTGNMFHGFAINFARRFSLDGLMVTGFSKVGDLNGALGAGAVLLLSVDNQFIPQVSMPDLGISKLKTARHLIIVHGLSEGRCVCTDVFNPRGNERSLRNIRVKPEDIDRFLLSPKMPHIEPRATVLAEASAVKNVISQLEEENVSYKSVPKNPLLSFRQDLTLLEWLDEMRKVREKIGAEEWGLVDHINRQ